LLGCPTTDSNRNDPFIESTSSRQMAATQQQYLKVTPAPS